MTIILIALAFVAALGAGFVLGARASLVKVPKEEGEAIKAEVKGRVLSGAGGAAGVLAVVFAASPPGAPPPVIGDGWVCVFVGDDVDGGLPELEGFSGSCEWRMVEIEGVEVQQVDCGETADAGEIE